jgi:hypothetical protein
MISKIMFWSLVLCMLIGLPLLGISLGQADIRTYLSFPPLTRYVAHAPFDGGVFVFFAAVDFLMAAGVLFLLKSGSGHGHARPKPSVQFPAWGWIGMAIMCLGWILAWTRFPWFASMQAYTFCLPWVGFILLVNALCVKRSGRSLLTESPARFAMLWPVSAIFWWFFEYLNRYVQNWYYVGVEDFTSLQYIFHASLAFATVLPAVLSTQRFLLTFGAFDPGLESLMPLRFLEDKRTAGAILVATAASLILIGRYPDLLYSLVWFAPLLVVTCLQTLRSEPTIFKGLCLGDWRAIAASAMAALICGFIWELWNFHSLAHWVYAIPYVDRFHIFEMPLLGYGGYLPFGLECLLVGQMILGNRLVMVPGDGPEAQQQNPQRRNH